MNEKIESVNHDTESLIRKYAPISGDIDVCISGMQDEIERLENLIADAPHAENCAWHHDTIGCAPKLYEISECDCWKSRA